MKIILAYIPVPHRGYKEFLNRHSDADKVYLIGEDLLSEFSHLRKNLPALTSIEVRSSLLAMNWCRVEISIANRKILESFSKYEKINNPFLQIIAPYEDVSIEVVKKYLPDSKVEYDNYFLRWDKNHTLDKLDVVPNCNISEEDFDKKVMSFLEKEKKHSSDFWRQLAACVVKNGEVIKFAFNTQVPDLENPYFFGDPRFNFSRGVNIELSTAEHAEARLIALCAKEGQATEGADLYVTTFPCPVCAKSIATAGFARCFFREGYSMLDAETILRSANVELIQVI